MPDNTENKDTPSSLPVPTKTDCACKEKNSLCSTAVIGIALLLLIGLLILKTQKSDPSQFALLPEDTFLYTECSEIDSASEMLASLPIWKNKVKELVPVIRQKLYNKFGADKEMAEKFTGNITSIGLAYTANNQSFVIVKCGNTLDIEKYFKAKASSSERASKGRRNDIKVFRIAGKKDLYMLKIGEYLTLADNMEILNRAIACFTEKAPSLASTGVSFSKQQLEETPYLRIYAALAPTQKMFSALPEYTQFLKSLALPEYTADSAMLYEAQLTNSGFIATANFITTKAALAAVKAAKTQTKNVETHGFFYYLIWAIIILLALIIGIPVGFLLLTLLIAVYFYIAAWMQGELVPIEPAELAELSPQIQEDLDLKDEKVKDNNK